jgi:hypothetical protein
MHNEHAAKDPYHRTMLIANVQQDASYSNSPSAFTSTHGLDKVFWGCIYRLSDCPFHYRPYHSRIREIECYARDDVSMMACERLRTNGNHELKQAKTLGWQIQAFTRHCGATS